MRMQAMSFVIARIHRICCARANIEHEASDARVYRISNIKTISARSTMRGTA
jgi:hypothetical protein